MKVTTSRLVPALAVLAFALPGAPRAEIGLDKEDKLTISGGVRFRLESDWDSHTPAGDEREDRNRARARVRVGLRYAPNAAVDFALRVRTGVEGSQQSQFVTLLDSDEGSASESDFFFDQWFLAAHRKGAWVQVGRINLPLWRQNEMVLDEDVTAAGIAGGYRSPPGPGRVELTTGYWSLPDGAIHVNGNLLAAQALYERTARRWGLTAALGSHVFRGSPGSINLLHGNGGRNYSIWVASLQARLGEGRRAVTLGLDAIHNAQGYSAADPDPFTAANRRRTDGYVLSASLGRAKEKGDWLVGYVYARIETLAVHTSYCQDDWVRWGGATQGDSSDMKGHELRGVVNFGGGFTLMARLYLAEAITTPQDGKRFRLDLGYDF